MLAMNAIPIAVHRTPATPEDLAGFETIHYFAEMADDNLVRALEAYGCTVTTHDFGDALTTLGDSPKGVIVIDLPQLSRSFSLCKMLRGEGIELPLVTLTASIDPFDEVLGLELGADEVVARQVHPRVLLARLRAISRRALGVRAPMLADILTFGGLCIDGANREVTLHGKRIESTSGEFDLLLLLARNAGHVMRRDEVLHKLRGLTEVEASRSVDARLYRLRRRFGDVPDIVNRIKTVRPYGYMFASAPW